MGKRSFEECYFHEAEYSEKVYAGDYHQKERIKLTNYRRSHHIFLRFLFLVEPLSTLGVVVDNIFLILS